MREFKSTMQLISNEDAMKEAADLANKTGETFLLDCAGLRMIITPNCDLAKLRSLYWKHLHGEGVRNGSILSYPATKGQ